MYQEKSGNPGRHVCTFFRKLQTCQARAPPKTFVYPNRRFSHLDKILKTIFFVAEKFICREKKVSFAYFEFPYR
jgi:hypothetical protein